jgi:glycosyltransferase involved in cell wall biosynthesis
MDIKVSIIICTYNGTAKLDSTLEHLSLLEVDDLSQIELIFVDNASSDSSLEFAKKKWISLGNPFQGTFINESIPGKLNAQEKAISLVKGEYILICDDDNSFRADYVKKGINYLNQNSDVGVIGGKGIATSIIEFPTWFEEFKYFFACGPQAKKTGNVMPTRNVVYGAGMWFRKSLYDRAKDFGFDFILKSRTGTKLTTGGEDSELCWAIIMQGYKVWYADDLVFDHQIDPKRLSLDYRTRLLEGMNDDIPMGRIYLRVWKNSITEHVRFFWFKELVYTVLLLLKQLLLVKLNKEQLNLYWGNIKFYLRARGQFDKAFNQVVDFYRNCKNE